MSSGNVRLWSTLQGTGVFDRDSSDNLTGGQINLTSGVGVRPMPGLVIGAITGYENTT